MTKCSLCGEPMPEGEEMFLFHGYSGKCPKPPLVQEAAPGGMVESKLAQLHDLSQVIGDLARQAAARFMGVLREPVPQAEQAAKKAERPEQLVPVAAHIETSIHVLEETAQVLRSMLDRCEL